MKNIRLLSEIKIIDWNIMTLPKNILHWSVADVAHWLEENHFQSEVQSFRDHQIDGKALTLLSKSDINELIKRVGPRVKFRAKLAQLTASRNISENDYHNKGNNNENINYNINNHNNIINNKQAHQQNQRYNLIQVYPSSHPPAPLPYVRYHPIENGMPNQSNTQFGNNNQVKQYNYQNIYPGNNPSNKNPSQQQQQQAQQPLYKTQNVPRPLNPHQSNQMQNYSMQNHQIQGGLQKSNLPSNDGRYPPYQQKQFIPQRGPDYSNINNNSNNNINNENINNSSTNSSHINCNTSLERTSTSNSITISSPVVIKKEKEDSPPSFCNESSLTSHVAYDENSCSQDMNRSDKEKDPKNDDFHKSKGPVLDNTKNAGESENEHFTVNTTKIDISSSSSMSKPINNYETTSISSETEKCQFGEKSIGFRDTSSGISEEERKRMEENPVTFMETASNLTDEERRQIEDGSMIYRDSSSISSEDVRQRDGEKPIDYREVSPILTESERRQIKEIQNSYRQSPSISNEEKHPGENQSLSSYRNSSPILTEDERRQVNEAANNFQESSELTEEERRQLEDDENLEIYSNSSGIYEQGKESGSDQTMEITSENENVVLLDDMNGHPPDSHHNENDVNVSMVRNENYDGQYYDFNNSSQQKFDQKFDHKFETKFDMKRSIEHVTNRLAVRERSKIFRRSEKKWHVSVNETAYQLALKEPKLLQNKKELRMIAEAEVRKTYRFAKGKSRSIAIPENRIIAEERKKQKLTKDKINEMKRQLNAEGEELSRQMRQCHMNLTLATQQSDVTKNMQLREKMQRLNQQQAKLHFKMDELLSKERKLNLVKASNAPSYDPALQYNINEQTHAPYGYVQGNAINQVPIVTPITPVVKPNSGSPTDQNPIHYSINEQNNGSFAYVPTGPGHMNGPINGSVNGPLMAPINGPINGPVNGPVNAPINAPLNVIPPVPSTPSMSPHIKTSTTSPLEQKTIHYNNMCEKSAGQYYIQGNPVSPIDKNSAQYYIQGNAVSPAPIVSKGHAEDQVRVVPLNNVENVSYVNYDTNMKVA